MSTKHPKTEFVLASIVAMFALHGNTKQFWPKIPYLSLRDESVGEHTRLIFNSFALVTLIQLLLGRLPRERALPRAGAVGVATAALPVLIGLNLRRLKLRAPLFEVYNFALVLLLPLAAAQLEQMLAQTISELDSTV